jgi:hypothetical protein
MLEFPYLARRISHKLPPNLPDGEQFRFRPIVTATVIGTSDQRQTDAVLDTGSDECLFPVSFLNLIGGKPRPTSGHMITWRGTRYSLVYADIVLGLDDLANKYQWQATVAFTAAPIKYALLGMTGCLEYFDARFRGADRVVELVANWKYPGTM